MLKKYKLSALIMIILLLLFVSSCQVKKKDTIVTSHSVKELYERHSYIGQIEYEGLDLNGLSQANNDIDYNIGSLTFGEYDNGDIASIRNLEVPYAEYCGYEMIVKKGDNVTYPFWAIAYSKNGKQSYYDALENGINISQYNMLPFTACDAMSFGYTAEGDRSSLYVSSLYRIEPAKNTDVMCQGTYSGAKYNCSINTFVSLIAANCITINEALRFTGAVDENYLNINSSDSALLSVRSVSTNINGEDVNILGACALEDSSGRFGVLEFIGNKAIWHEGTNYLFNYFIQNDYLFNDDGTYKEIWGKGIGRCDATVPCLDNIHTMEDHLRLMNNIDYINMFDENNMVDLRSEFADYDVFKKYDEYLSIGLNVENANELYPLFANYLDTEKEDIVLIDSYEEWNENKNHLKNIYNLEYCQNEENIEELTNLINWFKVFYNGLSNEDRIKINNVYYPYYKVIADPMNYRVTRWFNEEVSTSDTINFSDVCDWVYQKEVEK